MTAERTADADRELLELARQAGAAKFFADGQVKADENYLVTEGFLSRFAALVAAREREECARLIEQTKQWHGKGWFSSLCHLTTAAVAAAIRARSIMANGLTEDETSQTASVAGLTRDRSPKDTQ